MYELKKLIAFADRKSKEDKRLVIATIIKTVGSSYRKKGTQMIISEDLEYEGAISGGCVENEALRQSEIVLQKNESVIFVYDGEYKLGCKGKIFVLLEVLSLAAVEKLVPLFYEFYSQRRPIKLGLMRNDQATRAASYFLFDREKIEVGHVKNVDELSDSEELIIAPQNQLVIIGGEYDSVSLALLAHVSGFLTFLFVKETFNHKLPEEIRVAYKKPDEIASYVHFDQQTAVVLMTHSLSKDLNYLIELLKLESKYLGILGPPSRREIILNNLMAHDEDLIFTHSDKLEKMFGPIGQNIGAKTPEEISISVLSEIISVFNGQEVKLEI